MNSNQPIDQAKESKTTKTSKQENKRGIQTKNQKNKVPEISAPRVFPVCPLPPTPLEMRQMTSVPKQWSQSRESLPDSAYEEISDEFLEGAFHPDRHEEITRELGSNPKNQSENQNGVK